jgi:hypothetical protein
MEALKSCIVRNAGDEEYHEYVTALKQSRTILDYILDQILDHIWGGPDISFNQAQASD